MSPIRESPPICYSDEHCSVMWRSAQRSIEEHSTNMRISSVTETDIMAVPSTESGLKAHISKVKNADGSSSIVMVADPVGKYSSRVLANTVTNGFYSTVAMDGRNFSTHGFERGLLSDPVICFGDQCARMWQKAKSHLKRTTNLPIESESPNTLQLRSKDFSKSARIQMDSMLDGRSKITLQEVPANNSREYMRATDAFYREIKED